MYVVDPKVKEKINIFELFVKITNNMEEEDENSLNYNFFLENKKIENLVFITEKTFEVTVHEGHPHFSVYNL